MAIWLIEPIGNSPSSKVIVFLSYIVITLDGVGNAIGGDDLIIAIKANPIFQQPQFQIRLV